jgi:asparagine synthase (glutamine-hydrolysing)
VSFRYCVLVWDSRGRSAGTAAGSVAALLQRTSSGWQQALAADGLIALYAGARPGSSEALLLADGAGVVFGKLFEQSVGAETMRAAAELDVRQSSKIVATEGQHLIRNFWGRYVAVIRNSATAEVRVLRDPSGALPCFFTSFDGVSLFFSDTEDCLGLGILRFSINWKYIAAFVPYSALQIRATGLNEISEVQAGECVRLHHGAIARSFAWNPVQIAQGDGIEDVDAAVAALRRTTRACLRAWGSAYRGLIHNLSGGLDSSIVLGCLRDTLEQTPITCLHYFAPGRDEDERRYARLAASHAAVDLVEHALEPHHLKLEPLLNIRRSAKPWFYLHELERSEVEDRLAAERGATGLICGAGGDALFYQGRADLAVVDFMCRRGVRPELLRVALDAARIDRRSIWPLLRAAVRHRVRQRRWSPFSEALQQRTLVTPQAGELASSNEELLHPWFEAADNLTPGKVWHIVSMSLAAAFYDSFGRADGPERTVPLMSQPLIELCLSIPTYVSVSGGRDRAVARRAFANDVPAEIVRRRAKGAIDHYSVAVLDNNLPFVRELLLDGLLVRERILDRASLERHLSREHSPADFEYNEILHQHLCTEVWLRRWHEPQLRRVA